VCVEEKKSEGRKDDNHDNNHIMIVYNIQHTGKEEEEEATRRLFGAWVGVAGPFRLTHTAKKKCWIIINAFSCCGLKKC
jgi:hypothetical protein